MATLSIVLTANQAARAATGVGRWLGLGRDATAVETEAFLFAHLKHVTITMERRAASDAVSGDFNGA